MFPFSSFLKKTLLVALLVAIGLAALPASSVAAADLPPVGPLTNERLAQAWERLGQAYARQGERLANADEHIATLQALITTALSRGEDVTDLQAALDAFIAALPAAQAEHERGAAILASHAGFDESGQVTDATTALATVRSLAEVVRGSRGALQGTGGALCVEVRAFRQGHPRPGSGNPNQP